MFVKRLMVPMAAMALLLSACGEKQKTQPNTLVCDDPAISQSIQHSLQQFLKEQARQFAASDSRQFVDADKIIAAASELTVSLNNPSQVGTGSSSTCRGELNITIPADTLKLAETNAPLLYGETTLSDIIRQRLAGSSFSYNGSGVLSQTLQYTPEKSNNGSITLSYTDNSLPTATNALSAALLPYGVKNILMIDGKAVSREDALKGNLTPDEPEDATPEEPNSNEERNEGNRVSNSELELTRIENRALDNDINALWQKLDPTIQQELLTEQRTWIQTKSDTCRQAAAQTDDDVQSEYVQLQCDSRFTRERLRYLRDYSIQ